jgi:hypothetical protein
LFEIYKHFDIKIYLAVDIVDKYIDNHYIIVLIDIVDVHTFVDQVNDAYTSLVMEEYVIPMNWLILDVENLMMMMNTKIELIDQFHMSIDIFVLKVFN